MPDLCDMAAELQQQEIDQALARMQRPVRDTRWFCVDCGDLIEHRRRRAVPGACRCVECQALHERQSANRR